MTDKHAITPLLYRSPKEFTPPRWSDNYYSIETCSQGSYAVAEDEEKAAHIVKCVNSHDALVEALEEIAYMGISQSPAMNMPEKEWVYRLFGKCQQIAKAALKAARGEK